MPCASHLVPMPLPTPRPAVTEQDRRAGFVDTGSGEQSVSLGRHGSTISKLRMPAPRVLTRAGGRAPNLSAICSRVSHSGKARFLPRRQQSMAAKAITRQANMSPSRSRSERGLSTGGSSLKGPGVTLSAPPRSPVQRTIWRSRTPRYPPNPTLRSRVAWCKKRTTFVKS